jgi:molybdopterin molybdotransferase
MGNDKMIPLEKALEILLDSVHQIREAEPTELFHATNRILAQDVRADRDQPAFNKSAMDGFACKKSDLSEQLEVIDEIPAGSIPLKKIDHKQCARIFTGGMVPEGADIVVKVEETKQCGINKVEITGKNPSENIIYQSEHAMAGDVLLNKGLKLNPFHIGVMASCGISRPLVYRKPIVGILSTGSELIEPHQKPSPPMIRNSSAFQLYSQLLSSSCEPNYIGIIPDDREEMKLYISKAIPECDFIILTGGASVGDYDFVRDVFSDLGADERISRIAMKPGKPFIYAKIENNYLFGLSGNPVSASVQFELLLKPFIRKLTGNEEDQTTLSLPLAKSMKRKNSDRVYYFPIKITDNSMAEPLEYHGSDHISAFEKADGLASMPAGKSEINKGDLIDVRQI